MSDEQDDYKIEGLKVFKEGTEVDTDSLPNENPVRSENDPIEMVSDEEIRYMMQSLKSERKRKSEYTDNRDPVDSMEDSVNQKIRRSAKEIKAIKEELEQVMLSDDPVIIKIQAPTARNEYGDVFTFNVNDENRHELLAMFLFERQINYVMMATLYYMKNGVLLHTETCRVGELMKKFGLSEQIKTIRTKVAACRMIDAQLEHVSGRVADIESLKSEDAGDIIAYIEDTAIAVEEMEESYCQELYSELAGMRNQLKDHTETLDEFKEKLVCLGQDHTW